MSAVDQPMTFGADGPARRRVGRGWSLVLAVGVLAVAWVASPGGYARGATDYMVLTGDDVYHTSVLLSKAGFSPDVECVVVANGDDYMAATSSAVLAAIYGGPVLLTPSVSLDPRVGEEMSRLGPDLVFVVGTHASVVRSIAAQFPDLAAQGRIVLIGGVDGPDTAALVAEQLRARAGEERGVVLVSNDLGAAPLGSVVVASALAASKGWPLLFVPSSGELYGAVAEVLTAYAPKTVVRIRTTVELGGDAEVVTLEGADRYGVSASIAEYSASVGLSFAHVVVVAGPDELSPYGMAVGAYLARNKGIAVLCAAEELPPATVRTLLSGDGEITRLDFCGPQLRARQLAQEVVGAGAAMPKGFGEVAITKGARGPLVMWLEERLAELSYRPGDIDGVFDWQTRAAVMGFQKWERLKRDGIAGREIWWKLLAADRPTPTMHAEGTWIEVDRKRQLLLLCVDGAVYRTIAVSTGTPAVGIFTPAGEFRVERENTYERYRYKPLYIEEPGSYLAIHGFLNVPPAPASHGCIRMTWDDMDELHPLAPVGTPVYIY